MLNQLLTIDSQLTFIIFSLPHSLLLVTFFTFWSALGSFFVIWTIGAVFLLIYEKHRRHGFIIPFVISVVTAATLTNYVLKPLFARPRPLRNTEYIMNNVELKKQISTNENEANAGSAYPTDYSFPSGHAAVAFAAAGVLGAFDKKRRKWFYLAAGLVAISRVYLDFHFVSDVIMGTIVGYITAQLTLAVIPQLVIARKR